MKEYERRKTSPDFAKTNPKLVASTGKTLEKTKKQIYEIDANKT